MAEHSISSVSEVSTEITIIRCKCGAPESHKDAVCPRGKVVRLGTVSYWHRNPLRRWVWALKQFLKRKQ